MPTAAHSSSFQLAVIFLSGLLTASASAQIVTGPTLVQDIHTGPSTIVNDSAPTWLAASGDRAVFAANGAAVGREIWVTDGTAVGTHQLPELVAGNGVSNPYAGLTLPSGMVLVAGIGDGVGGELFVVDPIAETVALVRDIQPGPASSSAHGLVEWQGEAWFMANDGVNGFELWRSDGTTAGTQLAFDLSPGSSSNGLAELFVAGGVLYVVATSPVRTLFAIASPAASPIQLAAGGSSSSSDFELLADINGQLLFNRVDAGTGDELWRTDGTVAGTSLLADLYPGSVGSAPRLLAADGSELWLSANAPGIGRELFVTDGTAAGTRLVADVQPGPGSGVNTTFPAAALSSAGLVFSGTDGATGIGTEPFFSAGTAATTVPLADLEPGPGGSNPATYSGFGGEVYFAANSSAFGRRLFRTDGTPAGTVLVADLDPASATDSVLALGMTSQGLLLSGDVQGPGQEPYFVVGTTGAVTSLGNLNPEPNTTDGITHGRGLTLRGERYFLATSEAHGRELWATDGTAAGTRLVFDLLPGPLTGAVDLVVALDERLLFRGSDWVSGTELWSTDGTAAGTVQVADIAAGQAGIAVHMAGVLDGIAYVAVVTQSARALWRSDGTPSGTWLVANVPTNFDPDGMVAFAGRLWFRAGGGSPNGIELWSSDGTAAGTFEVVDLEPGSDGSSPSELTVAGDYLYFAAETSVTGRELWRVDASGQVDLVADLNPGAADADPGQLHELNGQLFFAADDGTTFREPWMTDGTAAGTFSLGDLSGNSGPSVVGDPTRAGASLFFWTRDAADDFKLWRTRGTSASTVLIADQDNVGGDFGGGSIGAVGSGENVVFGHFQLATGNELWTANGSPGSAQLAADTSPGPRSSAPRGTSFARVGSRLLWVANDGVTGFELHAAPVVDLEGFVAEPYGIGCGAARIGSSGEVRSGGGVDITLAAGPLAPAALFVAPQPLYASIAPGCQLQLGGAPAAVTTLLTNAQGMATWSFLVGSQPSLVGAEVFLQWAVVQPAGPIGGAFALSDGLQLTVGK